MKKQLHDFESNTLLQVFIIKSTRLPLISHDSKEESYKIPLESQWSILTAPAGEGQVIMDLDDSGVLNDLVEMGVEYVHVCISLLDSTNKKQSKILIKLYLHVHLIIKHP